MKSRGIFVPNVPCGVKSLPFRFLPLKGKPFLMYRVELKVGWVALDCMVLKPQVPNVPYGVERRLYSGGCIPWVRGS